MKLPAKFFLRRSAILLLIWIFLLACSLLPLPGDSISTPAASPGQPVGPATPVDAQFTPGGQGTSVEPDPLDHLLAMRSVTINLTSLRPDGTSRTIDVEIDSAGNMHLIYGLPAIDPKTLPEGVDPKALPTGYEMYMVGGKVYQPDDQNPGWMTAPVDEDYLPRLSEQFRGPDGPALWLDLLPEGSIHAAEKDTVGGFAADKYTVNGQVGGQSISGTIWFEPQADALVQAELHVPAVLLSNPEDPQKGEILITLNAQKADVPPLTLPDAPDGQVEETATPNPQ